MLKNDHNGIFFVINCHSCPFEVDGFGCNPYPHGDGPCSTCKHKKGRKKKTCPADAIHDKMIAEGRDDYEDEPGYVCPCPKPTYCDIVSVVIVRDPDHKPPK